MNESSNQHTIESNNRWAPWLLILGFITLALLMFRHVLVPGYCLFTTDDNIGMIVGSKDGLPSGFLGSWSDTFFMGSSGGRVPIMWTNIFLWLMPTWFGFNWIHALDFLLASLFLAIFMRSAGLCWGAVVMGLLTAFWVGSNFTLTYAGHLGKFGVLIFAAVSLYGIRKTFDSDRPWLWSMVTGGFAGLMLMEQQDLALFFGLFLGAYALFRAGLFFNKGTRLKGLLFMVPMGVVAFLICSATIMGSYSRNVSDATVISESDPLQQWDFATQWSWPPDECIDFIAPGYMGWRSGEPAGPYWGRMGRSAGWEQTRQGFMNFKLENQYLGIIPILLALFAILAGIMDRGSRFTVHGSAVAKNEQRKEQVKAVHDSPCTVDVPSPASGVPASSLRTSQGKPASGVWRLASTSPRPFAAERRAEILFWGCVAVITLLLAFGKYFPLYALFYKLPFVSSIRNPNKFLQVFQLALGILAAYGAHLVFNWRNTCKDIP